MSRKASSIAVSKLARYASDPKSVFERVDTRAVRYGNQAHNSIGAGPSAVMFLVIALALVAAARYLRLI